MRAVDDADVFPSHAWRRALCISCVRMAVIAVPWICPHNSILCCTSPEGSGRADGSVAMARSSSAIQSLSSCFEVRSERLELSRKALVRDEREVHLVQREMEVPGEEMRRVPT